MVVISMCMQRNIKGQSIRLECEFAMMNYREAKNKRVQRLIDRGYSITPRIGFCRL